MEEKLSMRRTTPDGPGLTDAEMFELAEIFYRTAMRKLGTQKKDGGGGVNKTGSQSLHKSPEGVDPTEKA